MTCAMGWTMRASFWLKPMATPTGMVQRAEMSRAALTRRKVAQRAGQEPAEIGPGNSAEQHQGLHDSPCACDEDHDDEGPEDRCAFAFVAVIIDGVDDLVVAAVGQAAEDGLFDAGPELGRERGEARAAEKLEDGRGDAVGGLDLLEFEFVAPGDERTPEELVGGDDDEDDDGDAG